MTFIEALNCGKRELQSSNISDAEIDAWYLLEYITGMNKSMYFLHGNEQMSDSKWQQYCTLLNRRKEHIPLQYLTGTQEFMGLEFQVTEDVLIPRMDTECLVEKAEDFLKPGMSVLDMCTGSGCIAVSIKKRNPEVFVDAVDVSEAALKVAGKNALHHRTEITFIESDLFTKVEKQYDLIISNPPYIPSEVVDHLMPEVREHEPRLALDGTDDGLEFYRRISKAAASHLNKNGMILYEIGCEQAKDVSKILMENDFININVIQDLAGLDRIVYGGKKDV